MYDLAISPRLGVMPYVAPVGEPAIGDVAYMHRPSALNERFARWPTIGTMPYGVLTAGLFTKHAKLEGTLFNGREPDKDRVRFRLSPARLVWGPAVVP